VEEIVKNDQNIDHNNACVSVYLVIIAITRGLCTPAVDPALFRIDSEPNATISSVKLRGYGST
jgi:hypothetical protein